MWVLQWFPPCRSGPGCSAWWQLPSDTQVSRLGSACMDGAHGRCARCQGCPTSSHSWHTLGHTGCSGSMELAKPSCGATARFTPLCGWMGPVVLQVLWLLLSSLQTGVSWDVKTWPGRRWGPLVHSHGAEQLLVMSSQVILLSQDLGRLETGLLSLTVCGLEEPSWRVFPCRAF